MYLVFHLRPYFDQRGSKNKTILTRIKEKHATGINRTGTIWTAYGVENFSYIIQLYPIVGTGPDDQTKWATYLLFQLWNPHQNASSTSAVRFSCELTAELGYSPGTTVRFGALAPLTISCSPPIALSAKICCAKSSCVFGSSSANHTQYQFKCSSAGNTKNLHDTNPTSNSRIMLSLWPSASSTVPGYGGNIADPGRLWNALHSAFPGNLIYPLRSAPILLQAQVRARAMPTTMELFAQLMLLTQTLRLRLADHQRHTTRPRQQRRPTITRSFSTGRSGMWRSLVMRFVIYHGKALIFSLTKARMLGSSSLFD